jgi:hypothetical protein
MILEKYLELGRERWPATRRSQPRGIHLREALNWVYRAQDATPDRGVSHSYVFGKGWMRSYPETTGYLIPTLLNWHARSQEGDARRRALEMAAWELDVQLPSGAIPDLVTGSPVVFDTGQVLFGWLAAWRETGDALYRDAARRASDWLVEAMDPDGVWRRHGGPGTGPVVYNARAAWGLVEAGRCLEHASYLDRARAFLTWTLGQEAGNGWFEHNCLNDAARPLLHTIAYTAQGQLEAGTILQEPRLIEAARRTASALAEAVPSSGRMAGRFDRSWQPAASWACLTGMAQAVLVWGQLDRISGSQDFRDTADRVLGFLLQVHDVSSRNGGLRGGVRGSFPVNGDYCRYRVPNWATKFFVDALLADGSATRYPG